MRLFSMAPRWATKSSGMRPMAVAAMLLSSQYFAASRIQARSSSETHTLPGTCQAARKRSSVSPKQPSIQLTGVCSMSKWTVRHPGPASPRKTSSSSMLIALVVSQV